MIYLTDRARHLICTPYSIENLHLMADELGIKRCWFHKDHYDIPKRRIKEIEAKCTLITTREIVKIVRGETTKIHAITVDSAKSLLEIFGYPRQNDEYGLLAAKYYLNGPFEHVPDPDK